MNHDELRGQYQRAPIQVLFACNDPDSGAGTDRVSQIQIGDDPGIDLAASFVAFSQLKDEKRVRIARKEFPYESYQVWAGNWCWDCATMTGEVVVELLNWLKAHPRWFVSEGGLCSVDEIWDGERPFELLDIGHFLSGGRA